MLPNHWYPILFSSSLQRRPFPLRRGGLDLVLFRDEAGTAHCLFDRCPHRGVPLSLGTVRGGNLACGYHGFEFNGRGDCVYMPCEGRGARVPGGMTTSRYPIREHNGIIWLFWGAEERAGEVSIPTLEASENCGGYSYDATLEWPLYYATSLENNFDIHHFNFVHTSHSWLPGIGSQVREVEVTRLDNGLRFKCDVEPAPGERRRRAGTFRVEYRAPSLQAIMVGDTGGLVTVYDAPIDENHTHRMLRMYVPAVKNPLLGPIAARAFTLTAGKYAQLFEDLPFARHVASPGRDRLVRADAGIAAFRKFRRDALRAASEAELPAHVRTAMRWGAQVDRIAAAE